MNLVAQADRKYVTVWRVGKQRAIKIVSQIWGVEDSEKRRSGIHPIYATTKTNLNGVADILLVFKTLGRSVHVRLLFPHDSIGSTHERLG